MTSLPLVSPSTSSSSSSSSTSTDEVVYGMCQGCNQSSTRRLRRCSRCKAIWYCSKLCQEHDWVMHKYTCSRMPSRLEPWQGNRTSAFGADYLKRVDICLAWANAPAVKVICVREQPYRDLFKHERSSPLQFKPVHETRAKPLLYPMASMIRAFVMHDLSTLKRNDCQAIAAQLDTDLRMGDPFVNGAKTIAVPDKLSLKEYLCLGIIWPIALRCVLGKKPESAEELKQSNIHWNLIELLMRRGAYEAGRS